MRNLVAIALLVFCFTSGSSLAQGSGTTSVNPLDDGKEPERPFNVTTTLKGSIVSVDADYLTLRTKRDKVVTVKLTDKTRYKRKSKKTNPQDLTPGQNLRLVYKPAEDIFKEDEALTVRILE